MSLLIVKKANEDAKPEPGSKHNLGISRTIYALGYSFRDAFIWGTAASIAVFTSVTLGNKYKIKFIEQFSEKLIQADEWLKSKTKGPVLSVSIIAGFIVGHIIQIPSGARGWKKAQEAIERHDKVLSENTRLVEATSILAEDNEILKNKLMAATQVHTAENLKAKPIVAKDSNLPMADRIRAQQQVAEVPSANSI